MKRTVTVKHKKRIVLGFALLSLILVALTFRVGWHQIVRAEKAYELPDRGAGRESSKRVSFQRLPDFKKRIE